MIRQWIITTPEQAYQSTFPTIAPPSNDRLVVTDTTYQTMDGFGGCFNELGAIALEHLSEDKQQAVYEALFSEANGCGFTFCRMPIGASDYAAEWYSHNEVDGDYNMTSFSIERDRKYLLPYIKAAKKWQPEMALFASPWSPPTWMKTPKAYNYGRLRQEDQVLKAYALYFKKFIEAYEAEGIPIKQVHIQNEPFADQKFPSCLWHSEAFRVFIRDYLGPLFEAEGIDVEIWLGTLNGPTQMQFSMDGRIGIDLYDRYVDNILFDEGARKYIQGVGYQWAGQHVIARTKESFPELKLMQTENECGDGSNSYAYAQYVYNLMIHYLKNGVNSYTYWNMVLEPGGLSTWGWHQNTMVTVDPETKTYTFNPEYYVMRHMTQHVRPGAKRLGVAGHWAGASIAFVNADGSKVIVIQNALDRERDVTIEIDGQSFHYTLPANSFHTVCL